jgi:hypothetical protein
MAEQLPPPPVPKDCDLRGMPYMPLFGDRLFGSATWIAATADAKVAALRLWWRSFAHEVPASSLPDDDTLLADYAGYGIAVKAWRKVRTQAMRGFEKCRDGRLYHPMVAEVAREAWRQRLRNREKQEKWRNKNRPVTPRVTVMAGVSEPFRNAGSEAKGEGIGEAPAGLPPDEQTSPPAAARGSLEGSAHDANSIITELAARKRV